ncbi:MAG: sensor histidine kinase, partial [Planctomycetota bacterium]
MNSGRIASRFNWFIILAVTLTVVLIATSVSAYLIHSYDRDLIEKDRLHLKGVASSVKSFVDQAFTLNYQLSLNPLVTEQVRGAEPDWEKRLAAYLTTYDLNRGLQANSGPAPLPQMQLRYPFVELFFVQDAKGDQVMRSTGTIGHRGQRWWFRQFMADPEHRAFVSKSYYSISGDMPVSSVFHPMWSNQELIGVMGLDINFRHLQELVNNYLDAKGLYALVLDSEGVVIAHPDPNRMRELYDLKRLTRRVLVTDDEGKTVQDAKGHHKTREVAFVQPPVVQEIATRVLGGESGLREDIRFDGEEATVYYEPVRLPGGATARNYAVLLVRSSSFGAQSKVGIALFCTVAAFIIILALIALFRSRLNRIVIAPLETLTDSMREADLTTPEDVKLATGGEFETLASTYNEMRRSLHQLSNQLGRAKRMESLGLLAGGVAHDLNNILSGLVAYPDLLLMDNRIAEENRGALLSIKACGQRAAAVVGDLLTIARGVAIKMKVISIPGIVELYMRSEEFSALEGRSPGVRFETTVEAAQGNISGSPVHVGKALMNLVTNAAESIEGEGTVTVGVENRVLGQPFKGYEVVPEGVYTVLSVRDTGPGIGEELERIFEPFYTRKTMGRSGTGLGLAIVWNTMQDHHGFINVTSDESGTCFELFFPTSTESVDVGGGEEPVAPIPGAGETVLVVDDEAPLREMASTL